MSLTQLAEYQRIILESHRAIIALADGRPDGEKLAQARQHLSQTFNQYFALKQQVVLEPLRASAHPAHRAMARRCTEEDLRNRQVGMAHYQRWTRAAVAADPREYRMVLRQLLRVQERYVEYQRSIVFPMVREAAAAARAEAEAAAAA